MRTTLLGSLMLLAVGCTSATEINSEPSTATAETASAGERAQTLFFYGIEESDGVLHIQVPPYLAAQIAAAYGRPDLTAVLHAEVAAVNEKLIVFDASTQAIDEAEALVHALNAALALHVQNHDPRTLVFTGSAP